MVGLQSFPTWPTVMQIAIGRCTESGNDRTLHDEVASFGNCVELRYATFGVEKKKSPTVRFDALF